MSMKKTTQIFLGMLTVMLFGTSLSAQNVKEDQFEEAIKKANPEYRFNFDYKPKPNFPRPDEFKLMTVGYTSKKYYKLRYKTVMMYKGKSGYRTNFYGGSPTYDLNNEYYMKGKVMQYEKVKGGAFVLTADTIFYGNSEIVEYSTYRIFGKKLQVKSLNVEARSVSDKSCSNKNLSAVPKFIMSDGKLSGFQIEYTLDNCGDSPKKYTWKYDWNVKSEKLALTSGDGAEEIKSYLEADKFPAGVYNIYEYKISVSDKSSIKVDGETVYDHRFIIDFNDGTALMGMQTKGLKLKVVNDFSITKKGMFYEVNVGSFESKFDALISEDEKFLYLQGYDSANILHSIKLQNIYQDASAEKIKKLKDNKWIHSAIAEWNWMRANNYDVMKYLKDSRKLKYLRLTFRTPDKPNVYETSFTLAMLTGNVKMVKLFDKNLDMKKYRDQLIPLAEQSGSSEMMDYAKSLLDAEEAEKQEEVRKGLVRKIRNQFDRNNGWYMEQASYEITNVHNTPEMQIHNIKMIANTRDRGAFERSYFDIHEMVDGEWTSTTGSFHIDNGDAKIGEVKKVFQFGEDQFLYTEGIWRRITEVEEYYYIYKFDKELNQYVSVLNFYSHYDEDYCDATILRYEVDLSEIDSKSIKVTAITTDVVDCESGRPKKSVTNYRWSSRQNKFLETLE